MAQLVYYGPGEALCEVGFQGESDEKADVSTAVTPVITFKYLRSLTIRANENVQSGYFVNGGTGPNRNTIWKGSHSAEATMSFWIPKDLDQATPMEVWMLKNGVDGSSSVSESTQDTYTVPDSTNEYGVHYLNAITLEAGWNKTSNVIGQRVTGAVCKKMTVHLEEDQPILITQEYIAYQASMQIAFAAGTLTEASEAHFTWGDVSIAYGAAGASAAIDNITMLDFSIEHILMELKDLNNTTSTRCTTAFPVHRRVIGGTIRFNLETAAGNGQDLWESVFNDASGASTPTEGVTLKDIFVTLYQSSSYNIVFQLHDVVLGEISSELQGETIPSVTLPFTATACILIFKILGTVSAPTGWD